MNAPDIRTRRGGLKPIAHADRRELAGESEWIVSGNREVLADISAALGSPLAEQIGDSLLLSFGNAVGIFDLPHLGRIEVVSGKWSRQDFDAMLSDLTDIASALPFRGGEPAALPYDRSVAARKDLLYSCFVYVRHILSDSAPRHERLLPVLAAILADPHRRLFQERISERLERARGVDPRTLERLASHPGPMIRATGRQASAPVAQRLRGHLPERVEERRSLSTVDTAENRFIKSFLQSIDAILEAMETACHEMERSDLFIHGTLADCQRLRRTLAPVLRHRMWTEVGIMVHLPASSTVLQRRRGYRQVFEHFSRLRLAARVPLDRDLVRRLLEARDVAELYELWCFFKMSRAVEEILGPPIQAVAFASRTTHLVVRRELRVVWPGGISLAYNRSFSRSGGGSYSVPLRPDITLDIPGAGLHLFDAKFRLESLARVMDAVEDEDRRGFRRGDLYKMHTYRDAIPEARSVWILYPGSEVRFFGIGLERWDGNRPLPERLEGVGAIPLVPGQDPLNGLRQVLGTLFGRNRA